jgi:hypothetical protein
MIGDATEEFHTAPSGEGNFDLPSPRRRDMGASLAPVTTTLWKENAPAAQATMTVPPQMVVPRLETGLPFERRHAHHRGGGRVAGTSPCSTPHYQATGSAMAKPALQQASCYRGSITRTAAVQAHTRGREDLDCGLRLHSSSCRGGGSPSQPRGGLAEAATAKHLSVSPLLTTDGVDKMPPTSGDSSHRRRITSGVYSLASV